MDLKKEIKLSDLVPKRRTPKEPDAFEEFKEARKTSALKKEITLPKLFKRTPKDPTKETPEEGAGKERPKRKLGLRARREKAPKTPKQPKQPKQPKKPKEPKQKRERRSRRDKQAPALPQVPLMRAFNLLPKEDARERRGPGALKPAYVAVVLAALLAVGGVGALYLKAGAGLSEKKAEVSELQAELAAAQEPSKDVPRTADPQLAQEQQSRTAAVADVLAGRVAWDRLLRELALVVPKNAWTWQVIGQPAAADPTGGTAAPGRSFEVDGCAENHDDIADLLVRLTAVPEFSEVSLTSALRQKPEEDPCFGRVKFTLVGTLKPLGAAGQ